MASLLTRLQYWPISNSNKPCFNCRSGLLPTVLVGRLVPYLACYNLFVKMRLRNLVRTRIVVTAVLVFGIVLLGTLDPRVLFLLPVLLSFVYIVLAIFLVGMLASWIREIPTGKMRVRFSTLYFKKSPKTFVFVALYCVIVVSLLLTGLFYKAMYILAHRLEPVGSMPDRQIFLMAVLVLVLSVGGLLVTRTEERAASILEKIL